MDSLTCMVYVVFPTLAEAKEISQLVLSKRLCACTNIYPSIESSYWWEGKVEHSSEVAMFIKTSALKLDELITTITDAHSYDCPCVVATDIKVGNEAYLKWIIDEAS